MRVADPYAKGLRQRQRICPAVSRADKSPARTIRRATGYGNSLPAPSWPRSRVGSAPRYLRCLEIASDRVAFTPVQCVSKIAWQAQAGRRPRNFFWHQ
jgi:hypothetical protein